MWAAFTFTLTLLLSVKSELNALAAALTNSSLAEETYSMSWYSSFESAQDLWFMKHLCFWRQNEPCFLNPQWCMAARNTFLKQMYGVSKKKRRLLCVSASFALVGVRLSLILIPTSSVFPLTSSSFIIFFLLFCDALLTELPGNNSRTTCSEPSVLGNSHQAQKP